MSRRRRFSGELKARVALEALRGDRTLQEIASQHQVHPNQVSTWKRQAIAGLGDVFSNGIERSRLLRLMGLQAVYRAPRTSAPRPEHRLYPYLLKALAIERANHVWCADITYIPVRRGFLYLVAAMDWASRYVLAWRLSNTLYASFCVEALEEALARHGTPEIFNTDQGSQFTGFAFTGRLRMAGVRISMDGRGRCLDNILIERLWRSLKYEAVYLRELADGFEARSSHRRMDRLLQHREAALGARRADAGRGLRRRCACGYGGQGRYAPCPHPHRRNSNGKEIDSKAFWRHERQTEYTLTGSPDCPKKRSHLSPGNQ